MGSRADRVAREIVPGRAVLKTCKRKQDHASTDN